MKYSLLIQKFLYFSRKLFLEIVFVAFCCHCRFNYISSQWCILVDFFSWANKDVLHSTIFTSYIAIVLQNNYVFACNINVVNGVFFRGLKGQGFSGLKFIVFYDSERLNLVKQPA